MSNITQWGKEVKKAAIEQDMSLLDVAYKAHLNYQAVTALINGRYAKRNYAEMAEKINAVLGTTGIPPRPPVPSDEWCKAVRKSMVDNDMMKVNDLAEQTGFSRDRVSLVINGNFYDEPVIEKINVILNISEPVLATS